MIKKIKILHLEDSLKDSELIHFLIESGGIEHEYFLADNEKEFLKILETENIDIILCDYSMPDYGGHQALMVAKEKYPDIPFIFVSGTIEEDYAIKAMLDGAKDFVLKHKLTRLVPAIKRALREHELKDERKLAEEKLLKSEMQLSDAMDIAHLGPWEYDVSKDEFTFNDHFYKMFRVTAEQVGGYKMSSSAYVQRFVYPDDMALVGKAISNAFRSEKQDEGISLEHRILYGNGETAYIAVKIFIIKDSSGNTIKAYGVNQDITERKQAEEALRESEQKFRGYMEYAPDGIFIVNADGFCVDINPAACKLLGYSEEEMMKMHVIQIVLIDDRERAKDAFNILSTTGKFSGELQFARKDRSTFYGILSSVKISENQFLGFVKNIDDIKNTQQQIIKAMEHALESDRMKTAFLCNVSHEIRTPMNAIIGFIDPLLSEDISADDKKEFGHIMKSGSVQLLSLIDEIIAFANIEAGAASPKLQSVSISKIFNTVFEMLKLSASKKGLDFDMQLNLPDKNIKILTDEPKLRQVLINLIGNAIKFTDAGSVHFGCSFNNGNEKELLFYVRDTGIGINEIEHNHVFERFGQSNTIDIVKYGGTGLGLSISKAFVEMLSGRIWIDSSPGKGSTFYFTIPLIDKHISTPVNEAASKSNFIWKGKTILIAEDKEINFQLCTAIFHNTEVIIIRAMNGQDAIEKLLTHPEIELILMDIKMPVMDGLEATRKIREFNKTIPIIAQTAFAEEADREKAIKVGCNDYQLKPINKALLLTSIDSFIK